MPSNNEPNYETKRGLLKYKCYTLIAPSLSRSIPRPNTTGQHCRPMGLPRLLPIKHKQVVLILSALEVCLWLVTIQVDCYLPLNSCKWLTTKPVITSFMGTEVSVVGFLSTWHKSRSILEEGIIIEKKCLHKIGLIKSVWLIDNRCGRAWITRGVRIPKKVGWVSSVV